MEQYTVTGMSCAACSNRIEKAVSKVEGVTSCSVSLLTNSMGVEGSASSGNIIKAVEDAGYGARLKSGSKATDNGKGSIAKGESGNSYNEYEEMLKDRETPALKRRLIVSLVFLCVLMYFSMGHMMWGWPVPEIISDNHVAMGLIQMLLTIAIMVCNQKFFVSGFKSLFKGAPNMDTLVAMGSSAAFIYSTYALFAMTDAVIHGTDADVMKYMDEFYFESAATILTLITVGKMLEARSKGKTTNALKGLMKLAPKTARIIRDGEEIEVSINEVNLGDIFVVRPGENIPVDGVVIEGTSAVNESALTGESIPTDKEEGSEVWGATLNQSGFIKCRATRVGEDTTLSQIIQMVSDVAATKAPIAKVADKVSEIFVPTVITLAVITLIVWLLAGQSVGFALARAISVLVISCPCALGLATPVAIMVGNGVGAKNGIMFKTAVSLEEAGKTQIVVLDKTGTITSGEPKVTDVLPVVDSKEARDALIKCAYALECKSEHPLAKAVISYAAQNNIKADNEISDFQALPGNGLRGKINNQVVLGGNNKFIMENAKIPENLRKTSEKFAEDGKTPLFFAKDGKLLGIIAVADVIKEDSPQAIKELQNMGIHVVILTGDNEKTANAIGKEAGVNQVIAGVLPDGKEKVVREFKKKGKVAMVGDGINDAPALTSADMGIAIGAGSDIAIDAAQVVLMKNRLIDVPAAIRLSRETLKNIHENLFWAFIYNIIGIPLAAGVWIPMFNLQLNPMFAAAAMSLSSFCVVTNALRLNLKKIYNPRHDKKIKSVIESDKSQKELDTINDNDLYNPGQDKYENKISDMEENKMNKTLKIEGMMCGHCEGRVKKSLEALDGVTEAVVSHEEGTAIVTLSSDVDDELLKKTVEDQDYKVTSIY